MAKKLNYLVGFTADTSSLQLALREAQEALLKVGTLSTGKSLTQDMQQAALAALQLSGYLRQATNEATGKLDLSKFSSSLRQSGLELKDYASRLLAIGPDGEKAFLQVASAISKAELPLMRTNKVLDGLWTTMKNTMRWQLTSSMLHGFMGAVSTAYGYTKDLNESLNSIQIVTDKNNESMAQFAENANKAAKALSTTTVDYTDASLIYYQQGLNDEEVLGRTNTTIKLANVAGETARTASEQLTAIWNNFYDGSKSLEYYADVMTALGATTASSTQEISAGLQKFAAVADTVGLSYEYATSALATITATTRESADVVGTSLRTLFARIQGLLQDETQDDGTTLNKYSKALAQVGISIKDTSGQLKGMNEILDEMGAKWGTLTTAQQMALAQTVAGVRQYTQLIALMENWDFFQENLGTAMGAEGTLEKLALIYADSWEAARDRVRAAAEDIYDSIINPNTFINIDDSLTPVLSGIADAIDALGGLRGMLVATGYVVTTLYGDKIAQSMRDMAYNISLLTGKELERQRAIKLTAAALAELMALDSANINVLNINDTEIQARKVGLLIQLNEKAKELSTIQYEQLLNEIELVEAIGQAAVAYAQQALAAELSADETAAALLLSDKTSYDFGNKTKGIYGDLKNLWDLLLRKNPLTLDLKINKASKLNLDSLLTSIRNVATTGGSLTNIKNLLNGLSTEFDKTNPKVQQLADEFKKLTGVDLNLQNLDLAKALVDLAILGTTDEVKILLSFLERLHVPPSIIQSLVSDCQAAGQAASEAGSSTDMYKQSLESLLTAIQNALSNISGWSLAVVAGARLLASLGMAMLAIKNLGSIWQEKDLEFGEKIIQTMTSLGMIIPSLMGLYTGLTEAILANTAAKIKNMSADEAMAFASGKSLILRVMGITVAKNAETGAVEANTVAWYANPMFWAAAAIVAGIVLITSAISNLKKALEATTQATIDNAKATKEELDSNRELISSTKEALDVYLETGDGKEELDEKTRALAEAYNLEGAALAKLSGKYEDYNTVIRQAIEKQKQELRDTLEDLEEAIAASEYKLLETARKGVGHVYDGLTYKGSFLGWNIGHNEEKEAYEILNYNVSSKFRDTVNSVTAPGRSNWAFKVDANDTQELLEFYDELNEALADMDAEMSATERGASGIYQATLEWRDKMQEAVEEYRELVDNANKIRILLGDVGSGIITEDLITNFAQFKEWVSQTTTELEKLGYSEEDIGEILDDLVKTSLNPAMTGFNDLYKAISDVENQVRDSALKNKISDIFSSSDYDAAVLATLHWGSLTTNTWELAYNSAKKYQDAVNQVSDATDQLSGIELAEKIIGKSKGEIDIDTLTGISNAIDWGSEEKNIVEFSAFLEMNARELTEYLQMLTSRSYDQIVEGLNQSIESSLEKIEQQQAFLDGVNTDTLNSAEKTLNNWRLVQQAYNEWLNLKETGQEENFDFSDLFLKAFSDLNIDWNDFKTKTKDEVLDAVEEGTKDATATVNVVADALNIIKDAQDQIDRDNTLLVITAKVKFENQLDDIESSVDGIVSIFDAISKGVESTTNEAGNKVWGFSREAAQAIESVYPGFIANAELLRDGTFALADDMYLAFFDSANGQLAADSQSKAGMLANIITMLEERKRSAQSALDIALKLATGETTLEQLSDEEKGILYTEFVNGKENANGEMLDDEVTMLTQSDTNWDNLWTHVSDYSAQGAENMATNVANSTGLVLQNLEKIRDAAYAACLLIGDIGNPNATKHEIDTTISYGTNSNWATTIDTSNVDTFFESLKDLTTVTADDLFMFGESADKVYSQKIGAQLTTYYLSLIDSYDTLIASAKIALSKLLEGIDNAYDKLAKAEKSENGSLSKQQYYLDEEEKKLKDILDRYHEITREIENQNDLLDDISNDIDRSYGANKIKNYKKELAELEKLQVNYNAKLKEAQEFYKPKDIEELKKLFGEDAVKFNPDTGEIDNYTELLLKTVDDYNNNFLSGYNAFMKEYTETTDKETKASLELLKHSWDERKRDADKEFKERLKALTQYESTLDTIQEMRDALEETARAIADNKLNELEYRFQLVIDVKSMKNSLKEFQKNLQGIFNDELTHGIAVADISRDQAQLEADMLPTYQSQLAELHKQYDSADNAMDRERIMEDIKDITQLALDSAETIVDWVNSIEDLIPAAVDAAKARYDVFLNQLQHNQTILSTIKELYALQGATYKTQEGFNRLQKVSQEKLNAQVGEAKLQKAWYDEARVRLEQAQVQLDSLGGDETDIRYDTYKKARDAYLVEFNEAEEAYLSLAKEAMETAQEMYMELLEKAVYDFGQVVSNGVGLDLLQDKYDHYIEQDERYFDKVNEAYQTTAWYNKLQLDIDKATNSATRDRLKALQEEINIRRENNKLSQYDLDILNAKYEVLQAQMALEDAQNAKNQMMLARDSLGNWNYQFYADPTEVEGKEQELLDAENEWYNIAKQLVTDVTGEIISTWLECQEKVQEIYSDMTLTDEERAARAEEIYQYYTEKIKYLEEEKQIAIADMTEAGNASLFTAAVLMGDELTDLTGLTADDIKSLVEENGGSVIGLLTADNETIKNIIASNTGLIDLFDNTYATDLANMTSNTDKFETELERLLGECQTDYENYRTKVNEVADETGTKMEQLDEKTDEVAESTRILTERGEDAALELWEMVDATADAVDGYLDLAEAIMETVRALEQLAIAETAWVELESKVDQDIPMPDVGTTPETPTSTTSEPTPTIPQPLTTGNGTPYDDATLAKGIAASIWIDPKSDWKNGGNWKTNVRAEYGQDMVDAVNDALIQGGYKSNSIWSENYVGPGNSILAYKDNGASSFLRKNLVGYDTGGYTGEFADGKLAFLHEKELVLNKEDTANILKAVDTVRTLGDVFATIERMIDGNGIAAMALMGLKLTASMIGTVGDTIELTIHIDEVSFPNVTSSDEIKEAFESIANDAVQWARRRKD